MDVIGTQNEHALHAALKVFFEPDMAYHEQKYKRYIADIKKGNSIIEIQTRAFNAMRGKLKVFLDDGLDVTVVYPIAQKKWIVWINPETGEVSDKRKSPKIGQVYDCFRELYKIKQFLTFENLHFKLVLVDMEEHKLLNGWSADRKKGSERKERYPVGEYNITDIKSKDDYKILVPDSLPETFMVKDFMKATKISRSSAGLALNVLSYIGTVVKTGKEHNAFIYSRAF